MNIQAQFDVIDDLLHDAQAALALAKILENHKPHVVSKLQSTHINEQATLCVNGHYHTFTLIDTNDGVELKIC